MRQVVGLSERSAARCASRASQPKEIRLGEETLDEMCLGALSFVVKLAQ